MTRLTKADTERLWFLDRWHRNFGWGWSVNLLRGKKWDAHFSYLVRRGLFEADDPGDPETLYRMTDAGRAALSQSPNPPEIPDSSSQED